MNIHQIENYVEIWNCKGYKSLNFDNFKGRILYRYSIPYKTIIGGMEGTGVMVYSEDNIEGILKKSRGAVLIYDFEEKPILEKYGFKRFDDWTMIIDISDIKKLWERLDKKNRNDIRFAEKQNVKFEEIASKEELNELYRLFKEQSKRLDFRIPGKDYFDNVWDFMVNKNIAKFFIVSLNKEPIAVAQIFNYKDTVSLPIWGTSDKSKEIRGTNNYLIWKILEWGNKNGYERFNFWGVNPKQEGIFNFKKSFGGELVKVYRYEKPSLFYNIAKKIFARKE